MFVQTKAIVLHTTKYQEKSLIVKCYTEKVGIVSFFLPSVVSSKKSSRVAYFQPFSLLDIAFEHKKKGKLEYFKEYKFSFSNSSDFDIAKSSIVFFLSEVLDQVLKEEVHDINLFTFLETSILWLNTHHKLHNFHLIFLCELSKYLGFYPELSQGVYFDLLEGKFLDSPTSFSVNEQESEYLKKMFSLKYSDEELLFSKHERNELLNILFKYYKLHNLPVNKVNSLEILKEIF